jgi:O-antigen ligase
MLDRLHPLLVLPVFVSVLAGRPPLWASWTAALTPFVIRLVSERRLFRRTPFDLAIALSIAGFIIGCAVAPDKQIAMTFLNTYLACIALFYAVTNNDRAPLPYWLAIAAFVLLVVVFLTLWVFQNAAVRHVAYNDLVFKLASHLNWRLPLGAHTNALGAAFAVVIPGLAGVALFPQRAWLRWCAGFLATLFAAVLVFSASPGGWAAAAVGVLVVLTARSWKALLVFLSGLVAGAVALFYAQPAWLVKLFTPLDSLNGRLAIWGATLSSLRNSPMLGLGLGGWTSRVPTDVASNNITHNAYLQLYCDTGAISILILLAGMIGFFQAAGRIWRSSRGSPLYGAGIGAIGGLVAFGVHGLVDVNTAAVIHTGQETLYFAVPLMWLWGAFLVVLDRNLMSANGRHAPIT